MVVPDELQHQESRGDAEGDRVAKAVELSAEVGGVLGPAGGAAVEHVEHHAEKNQYRGDEQLVAESADSSGDDKVGRLQHGGPDFGRKRNRSKPANGVP